MLNVKVKAILERSIDCWTFQSSNILRLGCAMKPADRSNALRPSLSNHGQYTFPTALRHSIELIQQYENAN